MQRLTLHTAPDHYDSAHRYDLRVLLKAQWNDRSTEERTAVYGAHHEQFVISDDIHAADACVLPMRWTYYLDRGKRAQAEAYIREAHAAHKWIFIWHEGDYHTPIQYPNAIVHQASLHQSKRLPQEHAAPPFFEDVLMTRRETLNLRPKQARPIVGFCGQAFGPSPAMLASILRNGRHHLRHRLGKTALEPPPLIPPQRLRQRLLNLLDQSAQIDTHFIIHQRYRAGVDPNLGANHPARIDSRQAYYDNMDASDYILCVRGTGNWSKRFYETLNWGRIPLFVNTDCVLPYDFIIDWRQHVVWVEASDLPHIGALAADFHAGIHPDDFLAMQQRNRQLWVDWLSIAGFWVNFHRHLPTTPPPALDLTRFGG